MFDLDFFIESVTIGIALAMDAFSVSLANGLHEPNMKRGKSLTVAGAFGIFQGLMPFIGWILVHTLAEQFEVINNLIPWVALGLLGYIGGKMLVEGIEEYRCRRGGGNECPVPQTLGFTAILVQGVATSIDALSTGLMIPHYTLPEALVCALIIALITFAICFAGVHIGRKFGTVLSGGSSIFGGSILIIIGLEIFISSVIK